jgi:enoyl-CoA hydratase
MEEYKQFKVSIENNIAHVAFNRPKKANSLNGEAWIEMKAIFEALHKNVDARVIILSGEGKNFCAGIDLQLLMNASQFDAKCEARKREQLRDFIIHLQDCITAIEKCRKPVIAAIHGCCIGGGVDIVSACDMRYATKDAYFSIQEINLGLVADIGTLQRMPKIIAPGIMAELAYTGRKFYGAEAKEIGFSNRTYENKESMMEGVMGLAKEIASKSPLCIRGTKEILLYTRDHSVDESLNYMVAWNASMLLSNDIFEAMAAYMQKRDAVFEG